MMTTTMSSIKSNRHNHVKKGTHMSKKSEFKRHFRIYLKNGHPAYIVDEEGNLYVFHRVTHSKTSGGKKTWEKKPNPLKGDNRPMHIVKQEQRDKKHRFSLFEIELKNGVDVSYPDIKKVGRTQTHQDDGRVTITSDADIKTK